MQYTAATTTGISCSTSTRAIPLQAAKLDNAVFLVVVEVVAKRVTDGVAVENHERGERRLYQRSKGFTQRGLTRAREFQYPNNHPCLSG